MISKINRLLRLKKGSDERGGLMIEAIAMLGMIAMVTPMLFRKSQERTNDIRDISIASHMRSIMSGVDDYIRSNYSDIQNGNTVTYASCTPSAVDYSGALPTVDVIDTGHFCNFLPVGYKNLAPAILGEYRVAIRRESIGGKTVVSAVLATKDGTKLTSSRSSKVSSMIGAHGGYIKPSSNTKMSGNQGAWELDVANYFAGAWKPGNDSIVVTSSYTGVSDTSEFLYRTAVGGAVEFNTMLTDLYLGNNDILDVNKMIMGANLANADDAIEIKHGGVLVTDGDVTLTAGDVNAVGGVFSGDVGAVNVTASGTVTGANLVGTNSLNVGAGSFDVDSNGNVDADGTLKVGSGDQFNVDASGNVNTSGTGTFGGLLTASNGLAVTGNADISGDTTTTNLTASGNVTANSLNVTTDGTIGGNLNVTGSTTTGTLAVTGNATVGDTLTVTNGITSTNGDITSGRDVIANRNVQATSNVSAGGNLYALSGDFEVSTGANGNQILLKDGATNRFEVNTDGAGNKQMFLRDGYAEVTHGTDKLAEQGYIKVERMLSDQAFTLPVATLDCSTSPCSVVSTSKADPEGYDKYQVNPSHTSVMKDIKLASRGGARLSEILPDFINKGIFVLDNTYKQYAKTIPSGEQLKSYGRVDINGDGFINGLDQVDTDNDGVADTDAWLLNWSGKNCGSTGNSDCQPPIDFTNNKLYDANAEECPPDQFLCQTSPWMGFIPSPVCPENYSAIVTMSPVRWRSSRAYAQGVDANTLGDTIEISPDTDKPATFQTNTWTALTVEAYCDDNGDATPDGCSEVVPTETFYGWSGMMGFLYPFDDDGDGTQDQIAWNVWPVNNKELSSIANIYCLFMRRNPGINGTPRWNPDVVDVNYDQLRNFRYAGDYGDKTNTEQSTTEGTTSITIGGQTFNNIVTYSFDGGSNPEGLYDTRIKNGAVDKHTYDEPWN